MAALCLVLVLEGLLLLVSPAGWKRMASEVQRQPDGMLRGVGVTMILIGLVALQFVR